MIRARGPARLVLAGVALALLAAGVWLVVRPAPRSAPARAEEAAAPLENGEGRSTLVAAELAAPAAAALAPDARTPSRESAGPEVPHGPVRGRLVDVDDGMPLEAELSILLASDGDRVAETLRSDARGRFASTRRFPRGTLRAFVTGADGERLARHEALFDPQADGEWLLPVPDPGEARRLAKTPEHPEITALRGRVVDLARRPVADAHVRLIPLGDAGELAIDSTDGEGDFELETLEPGTYRLHVLGRFARSEPLDLVVVEGPNDAGDVVLPVPAGGGDLRGSIVLDGREESLYFLRLRDVASGKEVVESKWELFGKDDGQVGFEIRDVPPGEYELSVVALDGLAFEPEVMRVSPPENALEFRAVGTAPPWVRVRVRDAESGEPIEHAVFLFRIHGQWMGASGPSDEELPVLAWRPWIVYSPAHRIERTDLERAARVPCDEHGECYELDVALRRGFGAAVVCKDLESDRLVLPELDELPVVAPGLAGVRVLADGVHVGTSDADGLALVDLPRKPRTLTFERPGWRVVGDDLEEGVRWVFLAPE